MTHTESVFVRISPFIILKIQDTCGTNAAATRVAHLKFLESQAQAEASSE